MSQEKLESAKNLFFIALGIDMAATLLVIASSLWGAGILKDIGAGTITVSQSTISTMEFWDSFAKVMILTMIGVGLGLVKWLNACYLYAKEAIGASGFKNESWTATGWIIPIFNLFKPYQIVTEIYKAGAQTYSTSEGWKKAGGSGLLLSWWIFWAITHFIGWIAGKQLLRSSLQEDMTLQQSIHLIEFQVGVCVTSLIVAGLWFAVAGGLTRRLLERHSLGDSSLGSVRSEAMVLPTTALRPPTFPQITTTQVVNVVTCENATLHEAPMSTPASFDLIDKDSIYAVVAEELETGKTDKGLWTRLFAECGGDEKQVKVLYIKRRAEKLLEAEMARHQQLALQHAERQRQEALKAEQAQQWHRRNAGLADAGLIEAVSDGSWSIAYQMLESGVSPFGSNEEGITLRDLANRRGDKQMVDLIKTYEVKATGQKVIRGN